MKTMNLSRWAQKALTVCSITTLIAAYSMVIFAAPNKPVGELIVTGNTAPDAAAVTVNGEAARSGRTIFASSTIATPESMGAMVNLGRAGKIELGPNTTFTLYGDGNTVSGDLASGSLTVLSAAESVNVKTLSGEMVTLNAGETVNATSGKAARDHRDPNTGKCIDDDNDGKEECGGGVPGWVWAALIGGVIVGVIIAVSGGGNESPPISPVR